jgi:hypothetical protein
VSGYEYDARGSRINLVRLKRKLRQAYVVHSEEAIAVGQATQRRRRYSVHGNSVQNYSSFRKRVGRYVKIDAN